MERSYWVSKIKSALKEVHNSENKSQREWTREFKRALSELGQSEFTVYPNEKAGEWLVDLCWSKDGNNWTKDFEGIYLACEIEWNRGIDYLLYDFQKLTVIDAEIRLFIFQYDTLDKCKELMEALKKACEFTRQKGYYYLIAGSGNKEEAEICFTEIPESIDKQEQASNC